MAAENNDRLSNHLGPEDERRISRLVRKRTQRIAYIGQTFPLGGPLMDRRLILFSNQILHEVFGEVLGEQNREDASALSRMFLGLLRTSASKGFIDESLFETKMMIIVFSRLDYLLETERERYEPILMPRAAQLKQLFDY
jgi:hypothetical protein